MPRPTYPPLKNTYLSAFKQKLERIEEKLPPRLNITEALGIQSSSTLKRYKSGETGPPPPRLVAIALVALHLKDPAAYAHADKRIEAAIGFVHEVGYGDEVSPEKLAELVEEQYKAIRDELRPEETQTRRDRQQMLATFKPNIANRMDLCNRSQSNYADELHAFIEEEYGQPCALVFVWQWFEDKTPDRLNPHDPTGPGKQAIRFLSGLLRKYPNFCLIALLTGMTDKETGKSKSPSATVMQPLEKFRDDVIQWVNMKLPEHDGPSPPRAKSKGGDGEAGADRNDRIDGRRIQFFYGTRDTYTHIFDSQICLGTFQKDPVGYSVTDNDDLYETIERVESGLEDEPWLWSSMVTALDKERTVRLRNYFGIQPVIGKKPLDVFPPWRIDASRNGWGWTPVGPEGDDLLVNPEG